MTHSESMRRWHRKMTLARRCHWCGRPSAKDYRGACDNHVGRARQLNAESQARRRERREKTNICDHCGGRPRQFGYQQCDVCRRKQADKAVFRRLKRREAQHDGYVNISEAAQMLGVHRVTVHHLIKKGELHCRYQTGVKRPTWYLSEKEVSRLVDKRRATAKPNRRCLNCGHKWQR